MVPYFGRSHLYFFMLIPNHGILSHSLYFITLHWYQAIKPYCEGWAEIGWLNQAFVKVYQMWGNIFREFNCPVTKDAFSVEKKARLLSEADRELFHINLAKLNLVCKTRYFNCNRIPLHLCNASNSISQAAEAVSHVIIFEESKAEDENWCYTEARCSIVDAAFASDHPDIKSQNNIAVFMGKALFFAASRKLRCFTKPQTDIELVPLSGNIQFVELFSEFTNTEMDMELCKQALQGNKVQLNYILTKQMVVDGLTKSARMWASL